MKKSKLIRLYETLQTSQLENLKKWVNSPIHNKHKELISLFDYLLSRHKITERTVNKTKVYEYIQPKESYNDLRMRHLMSLGVKLLEDFICFDWRAKETFDNTLILAEYCAEHKLDKFASQYVNKLKKSQQKVEQKNSFFYFQEYQLEQAVFDYTDEDNLQAIFSNNDCVFVIETLRYACVAIARQKITNISYQIPFLGAILSTIENGQYTHNIAIQFYYNTYQLLTAKLGKTYFEALQNLLLEQSHILPISELKDIYLTAVNYCIINLNRGQKSYEKAIFVLFEYGLESAILLENKQLSIFTYQKILGAALRLKKLNWAANFVQKYSAYLDPKKKRNYQLLAEAKLAFAKNKEAKTIQLLTQITTEEEGLLLEAKLLEIKICYQQKKGKILKMLLDEFQSLLTQKKLAATDKSNYKNIFKYIQKIIRVPSFDQSAISSLAQALKTAEPLSEREWLLEQLNQK